MGVSLNYFKYPYESWLFIYLQERLKEGVRQLFHHGNNIAKLAIRIYRFYILLYVFV